MLQCAISLWLGQLANMTLPYGSASIFPKLQGSIRPMYSAAGLDTEQD